MKNTHLKNLTKTLALAAIVFIGTAGITHADSFLRKDGGSVAQFQLAPKYAEPSLRTPLEPFDFLTSTYDMVLRVLGTSVFDTLIVYNDAAFDLFYVGFSNQSGATGNSDAKLNINGRMKISALADPSLPVNSLEPVCTNDFGKLERC